MIEVEFDDIKAVWIAWTNTDLTEGRGFSFPLYVTDSWETAVRLGNKGGVMGGGCPITKATAYRKGGTWFVPGRVVAESGEDAIKRKAREAREAALERAKAAGLSDDDLAALSNHR